MSDQIIHAISGDGMVRISVADMRGAVEQARQYHQLSPTTTAVLGRLLIGASIMGSDLKDEQFSVTLRLTGDGPCGTVPFPTGTVSAGAASSMQMWTCPSTKKGSWTLAELSAQAR